MFHYTDADGYKAIGSQLVWIFKPHQPPGSHPRGAYFTTLAPNTKYLASRLGVPHAKIEFVFAFLGESELKRLPGDRGEFILYSSVEYCVGPDRQIDFGRRTELVERMP